MYIVVLCTTKDKKEAKSIAKVLLENGLIACVNIIKCESMFIWEAKLETQKERLMVIKAKKENFSEIEQKIKLLHSYSNPEIISIDISDGSKEYLKWI